jgi:hypothetical protein
MEAKVEKLVAELKRNGTLDHWRSQLIDSFMASVRFPTIQKFSS